MHKLVRGLRWGRMLVSCFLLYGRERWELVEFNFRLGLGRQCHCNVFSQKDYIYFVSIIALLLPLLKPIADY